MNTIAKKPIAMVLVCAFLVLTMTLVLPATYDSPLFDAYAAAEHRIKWKVCILWGAICVEYVRVEKHNHNS